MAARSSASFRRRDSAGRPIVVHIFDGEPDQVRGITPFVSILKVARQFDQLADATLTAALIQTIFAAMFKSNSGGEDALDAMTGRQRAAAEVHQCSSRNRNGTSRQISISASTARCCTDSPAMNCSSSAPSIRTHL
jgi:capsid protein